MQKFESLAVDVYVHMQCTEACFGFCFETKLESEVNVIVDKSVHVSCSTEGEDKQCRYIVVTYTVT